MPLCYNIDFLLQLWLGVAPQYAAAFSVCFIMVSLIEAIGGPFWMAGHAIGNIKWLQLISGSIRLISIPIAYIILKHNYNPSYVFVAQVVLEIFVYTYRMIYLKNKMQFNIINYLTNVLFKLILVVCITVAVMYICCMGLNGWWALVLSSFLSMAVIGFLFFYYLISASQRIKIVGMIKNKIHI